MSNHRMALRVIFTAICLDFAAGLVFSGIEHIPTTLGLYWALTTATTVGYGDVAPHTTAGHIVAALVMITIVPLFAATFSLFTSGLTAIHVRREGEKMHRKLDHIIKHSDIPAYHD